MCLCRPWFSTSVDMTIIPNEDPGPGPWLDDDPAQDDEAES